MQKLWALKNKKGFTLIEIIVVLIILAILAAAGIPSMIGFIEDSRGKAFIAEARVGFVAAQIVLTENDGTPPSGFLTDPDSDDHFAALVQGVTAEDGFSAVTHTGGQVDGITYNSGTYTITISEGGAATVTKN